MNKLEQKQLLFLKKNYFTSVQKTLCKKFEQYGGEFTFKVENEPFKIIFKQSKAYTNFLFESITAAATFSILFGSISSSLR